MRLRNYIRPEEFPYTTPNGCVYDSGNYPKMLQVAKEQIGWEKLEKRDRLRREWKDGGWAIGIGTTLDSGTNNFGQVADRQSPRAVFPEIPKAQIVSWISMARSSSR